MARVPVRILTRYNMYRMHGVRPGYYGPQRFSKVVMAPSRERAAEFFGRNYPSDKFLGVSEDVYGPFMPSVERMLHPAEREEALERALAEERAKVRRLNRRYGFYNQGATPEEKEAYLEKIAQRDFDRRVETEERMAPIYPYQPYERTRAGEVDGRYMAPIIDDVHDRLRLQGIPEEEWGWIQPEVPFRYR